MPIDPSTAFVSYAREDREFVLRLAKDLKAKGAKIWMDRLDIRLGQRWDTEVETAVEQCGCMVVVLSPAAVASEKVKNEFMVALDEGKVVIPALIRECRVPLQLRRLQYADFRADYDIGLTDLAASLCGEQQPTAATIALTEQQAPSVSEREKLRELERRAHEGDPAAMWQLGNVYEFDQKPSDKLQAMNWYRKSAEAGDTTGMYYLACIFDGSSNSDWNAEAVELYRKAAEAGIGGAAYFLGQKYELGNGVTQDLGEARKLYSSSRMDSAAEALKRVDSKLAEKRRQEDEEKQKREAGELQRQRIAAEQARVQEERKQAEDEKARSEQEAREKSEPAITRPGILSRYPLWAKVAAVVLGALLVITVLIWQSRSPWQAQSSGTRVDLLSVAFVSPQTGWAVGWNGTILHTADGGRSWQPQNSGTEEWLWSVTFKSPQAGWAVGTNGTILHTADGGQSWQPQSSGTGNDLLSVAFVSPRAGWAVGTNGTILHTADGGQSWKPQSSGTKQSPRSVAFLSPQAGWAVGYGGTILHTADGGQSWQSQSGGTQQFLIAVTFVSPQAGWIVGSGGTILYFGR